MSERRLQRNRRQQQEREERRRRIAGKAGVAGGAALGATVVLAPAADAATFTVTNLNDAGAGSLRQAVIDANTNGGPDDVVFQSGLSGTIDLTGGQIAVTEAVDIQGPGAEQVTIDASYSSRIFEVNPIANEQEVRIAGLRLFEGYTSAEGAAIRNINAELTLDGMVVRTNGAYEQGGGVFSDLGSLTVTNSTFARNFLNGGESEGGAIYVDDTDGDQPTEVVIRDSSIRSNEATAEGGGIYVDSNDGAVLIERSTIVGNASRLEGGGIYVDSPNAPVTIDSSTIADNSASEEGGGVYIDEFNDEQITIQNTTISGNRSTEEGGGVYVDGDGDAATGSIAIHNSTITSNRAFSGGGFVTGWYFTGMLYDGVEPAVSSTIIAGNRAETNPDLGNDEVDPGATTEGGEFRIGNSLIGDPGAAQLNQTPAGSNLLGVDPLLGPLADNGGPTETHAPAADSPALDAGAVNGLGADQRGQARTFDASNIANGAGDGTDIGAVELAATGECKGKPATVLFEPGEPIVGSGANDVIVATAGNDTISTKGGKDTVCSGGGNDSVKGGGGNDHLRGEGGNDTIRGGGGKDKLFGNGGKDKLFGDGGKDTLKGGGGKDTLKGGPGKDKLNGGGGKDRETQ